MSRLTQIPGFTSRSTDGAARPDTSRRNRITVGAVFTYDNQGGTGAIVGTPGNATIHSRCELRMGRRRRVQEDLLDLTRERAEGQWWPFLVRPFARYGRG
jgi:hypothetical protein